MSKTCSESCRAGITLTEVVVSLALLGTLLVSLVVAHGRQTRQIREAQRRLQAADLVDAFLSDRFRDDVRWQGGASEGRLDETFRWRLVEKKDRAAARLKSVVMRLEVLSDLPRTASNERPVLAVELLVPEERIDRSLRGETLRPEGLVNARQSDQ